MRLAPALAGLALAILSYASPALAQESPRSYVGGVARVIEENYFDEARARQIATTLRTASANGEFDALTNQRELASALSVKLEPFDRHFRVGWTDTPRAQPEADSPVMSPTQSQAKQRRGNEHCQQGNWGHMLFLEFFFRGTCEMSGWQAPPGHSAVTQRM